MAVCFDGAINPEVGVELAGSFESDGSVIASTTPGGWVATTAHLGPYARLGEAHKAILPRCAQQGRKLAGPSWEIYGHWTDDPEQLRTDVFYLVEPSADPLVDL